MATTQNKKPVAKNKSPTEEMILKKKKYIQKWIAKGLTNKEIAKKLGIPFSSWTNNKKVLTEEVEEVKSPNRDSELDKILEEKVDLIRELVVLNFSNVEIAEKLEISKTTWYRYLAQSSLLREIIQDAQKLLQYDLENALARAAKGYEKDEVKMVMGEDGKKRYERTTRTYPVNVPAAKLLLQKIAPDEYTDKKNIVHSGNIDTTQKIDLSGLDEKELIALEKIISKCDTSES